MINAVVDSMMPEEEVIVEVDSVTAWVAFKPDNVEGAGTDTGAARSVHEIASVVVEGLNTLRSRQQPKGEKPCKQQIQHVFVIVSWVVSIRPLFLPTLYIFHSSKPEFWQRCFTNQNLTEADI